MTQMKKQCLLMLTVTVTMSLGTFSAQAESKVKLAKPALSAKAAAQEAFEQPTLGGLQALKKRGGVLDDLLVVERLPKGGYAAEVSVTINKRHIRLPLKLIRQQVPGCQHKGWVVQWAPKPEYVNALLNVAFTTHLPSPAETAKASTSWHKLKRLPSLPVVLTRFQAVTPFGAVSLKVAAPTSATKQVSEVAPPKALLVHVNRWVKGYLEEDKAPAGVDVIADGRTSWQNFQRVLFAASSFGLFKVYFVTRQANAFGAIPSAAPVFGSFPKANRPNPVILAYYPQDKQHGFRVSYKNAILKKAPACTPEMSFCVADVPAFDARLKVLAEGMRKKNPKNLQHALFATTKDVTIAQALSLISVIGQGLALSQGRVFVGYISR